MQIASDRDRHQGKNAVEICAPEAIGSHIVPQIPIVLSELMVLYVDGLVAVLVLDRSGTHGVGIGDVMIAGIEIVGHRVWKSTTISGGAGGEVGGHEHDAAAGKIGESHSRWQLNHIEHASRCPTNVGEIPTTECVCDLPGISCTEPEQDEDRNE